MLPWHLCLMWCFHVDVSWKGKVKLPWGALEWPYLWGRSQMTKALVIPLYPECMDSHLNVNEWAVECVTLNKMLDKKHEKWIKAYLRNIFGVGVLSMFIQRTKFYCQISHACSLSFWCSIFPTDLPWRIRTDRHAAGSCIRSSLCKVLWSKHRSL